MAIENKNSRLPKVTCLLNVNSTRSPFSHPCIYLRTLQRLSGWDKNKKKSLIFTLQLYFISLPRRSSHFEWRSICLWKPARCDKQKLWNPNRIYSDSSFTNLWYNQFHSQWKGLWWAHKFGAETSTFRWTLPCRYGHRRSERDPNWQNRLSPWHWASNWVLLRSSLQLAPTLVEKEVRWVPWNPSLRSRPSVPWRLTTGWRQIGRSRALGSCKAGRPNCFVPWNRKMCRPSFPPDCWRPSSYRWRNCRVWRHQRSGRCAQSNEAEWNQEIQTVPSLNSDCCTGR